LLQRDFLRLREYRASFAGGLSAYVRRRIRKMMQMHHFLPQFVAIVFLDKSTYGEKSLLPPGMYAEFQSAGEQSEIAVHYQG